MTIKEIEELSGMPRANIRFYEAEGLLRPDRDANGYRNYSEEDLRILQKIRLLRALHVSLEDIRQVASGKRHLEDVLSFHLRALRDQEEDHRSSREICEKLCVEQAEFASFDAVPYLDLLEKDPAGEDIGFEKYGSDAAYPWQRFFARELDLSIYGLIWSCFLSLGMHVNIRELSVGMMILGIVMQILLLILVEPFLLCLTGTTPGKCLFGFRVAAAEGRRLTWREALGRTWQVLKQGYGLQIPIYEWICLYRSYQACKAGKLLGWEEESRITKSSCRLPVRGILYVAVSAFLAAAGFFIWQAGAIPQNRGELTRREFCENYNQMQEYYGIHRPVNLPDTPLYQSVAHPMVLDEKGEWQELPGISQNFGGGYSALPVLEFKEEQGKVREIQFSLAYENENVTVTSYGDFMALAALSFICAQEEYSIVRNPPQEIYREVRANADQFQDFTVSAAGCVVECQVEETGYSWAEGGEVRTPVYGEASSYWLEFSVRKL